MSLSPDEQAAVNQYLGIRAPAFPAPPPAAPAPMNPPPVTVGSMNPPMRVNPDADALARQLGIAPAVPPPPAAPSSPVAPQALGLQLPAGIAPPGTTPAPIVPPPPNAVAVPPPRPAVAPPSAPLPRPAPAPAGQGGGASAGPREPSIGDWTAKRRGDERDYIGTFKSEREALDEAAKAAAVKQDEAAQATARMARLQEDQAASEAAFARDAAEQREAYRQQTQAQLDEVRAMKVDPGRLYRDAGAWNSVMVAVGGALSGMLSGMQGRGDNAFVDMINRNIDRDVAAQEHAIRQRTQGVEQRNTLYGQMVSQHRDEALAREQTRTAMLQSARTFMEAEAMRLGTPEAMARAKAADAQLAREQAAAQQKVDSAEEQAAIRAAQARAAAAAAAAAAAERAREKAFERGVKLEELSIKRYEAEHKGEGGAMSPGARFVATGTDPATGAATGYLARNAEVAQKRTDGLASTKKAVQLLNEIAAEREEQGKLGRFTSRNEGSPLGTPEWKTRNRARHAALALALKDAEHLGVLAGPDMGLIHDFVGEDPNKLDLMGNETTNRLRAAASILQRKIDAEGSQEAGTRVQKHVTPDGREIFAPIGGTNAPANPRAVQRLNADGTPKK